MSNIKKPKFLALCLGVTADLIAESDDSGPEMLSCMIGQLEELERCIPIVYSIMKARVGKGSELTLLSLSEYKRGCSILRETLIKSGRDRREQVRRSVEKALRGIAKQLENI